MSLAQAGLLPELRLAAVRVTCNPDMNNFVAHLEVVLAGVSISWHKLFLLKGVAASIGDLHKLDYINMCLNFSAKIALV